MSEHEEAGGGGGGQIADKLPNKVPTGVLYAPLDTNVSVGCTVIGPGIEPETEVTSILIEGDYLVISIQIVNGSSAVPWDNFSVPDGVNDYGPGNISEFTGLTLGYTSYLTFNCITSSSFESTVTNINETFAKTLSFKEDVKGWVSFKSFTPENAISMANDYYTFLNGGLYQHHIEPSDKNTFYVDQLGPIDSFTSSSVSVVLNDNPSYIKEFNTLNYEGSQSKVERFTFVSITDPDYVPIPFQPNTDYSDQEYYNLSAKDGWYVESIITNEEDGHIDEFLEKEGKWFNYIKREVDLTLNKADTGDFSFQGIGFVEYSVSDGNGEEVEREGMVGISGCTDRSATNFDPLATVDDGSCIYGKTEEEGEREEEGEGEGEDSTDTDTPTVGEGEEGREEGGGNGEDLDYR